MHIKLLTAAILALAVNSAMAEPSHRTNVKFGDEDVELKFSNVVGGERQQELWDATNEAANPTDQERFWRMRWEELGEVPALQSLAVFHLDRGDYMSAYAHLYAVDKMAKWYASTVTPDFKPAPGAGKYQPPGPVLKQIFAGVEAQMNLVSEQLTASQRAQGIKLAAKLVRDNPNCCAW
jgi:hypothetical protein